MQQTLSHYQISGVIGRGGMGVVHRATDTRLGRAVAIKILAPEAVGDPERQRRFIQEARAASALNHPHIVTIYEIDESEGVTFIAMELVAGRPLDRVLAEGPLTIATALNYGAQIASALEAAHTAGIVHRDIKPANVMVTQDGRVKVLDFGLAKLVERAPDEATMSVAGTRAGTLLGTAAYMSPEQAQGLPVDARSDLFSLGAVLYEMLAGRRPFAGSSDVGVMTAILRDHPPPLGSLRADLPAGVDAIVTRALAKEPAARYQSASAMREDLERMRQLDPRSAGSWTRRPALVAAALLVLLALSVFAIWQTINVRRANWVRIEAIPEIERLSLSGRSIHAVRLAREVERHAPPDIAHVRAGWPELPILTDPAGALVEVRDYGDVDGEWEPLGTSPVRPRLPFDYYRLRLTKAGYQTLEVAASVEPRTLRLMPETTSAPGMVFVPGGTYGIGVAPPVTLSDFWIDRIEVTNAAFKAFVDAGGYREPRYWTHAFGDGARVLTFDDAMMRLRDSTGLAGPATWELGSYPEGQSDHPVGGLSWFEAAAYAEFAGKSLPTLYHWFKAAGVSEAFSDILHLSNFDGRGSTPAGQRAGLGPWGTLDMAGNVKEWTLRGRGFRPALHPRRGMERTCL